ncbi:hypothetical protein DPMN_008515 [Dreissena polymorpha]|uniref:Uncharacterized protein n=1 Tax=Dreissena polymorpha TaxID=45954 RepID=A0A9D4RZB4_DREPO|nr:hypothetical protein DPMN_008515 [Dreissena polymorpha]
MPVRMAENGLNPTVSSTISTHGQRATEILGTSCSIPRTFDFNVVRINISTELL